MKAGLHRKSPKHVHIFHLLQPVPLLIGHAEAGVLAHIMDRRQDRVVKQKAAKVAPHRQLQVSHVHTRHRAMPIHGPVAIGTLAHFLEYKVEVAEKLLIVQA